MRTVQMTLDEDLVQTVDRVVKAPRTTLSPVRMREIRSAIAFAIALHE